MQEGFNDPFWGKCNNLSLEDNVARILAHWRKHERPIFHVQHLSRNPKSPLNPKHPGVEFMACAKPMSHEAVTQKNVNSCFIGTDLEDRLKRHGITDLVFVGIASDHCVSTSTRMAANLGFNCYIVSDATTSFDRTDQNGRTYPGDLVHAVSLASLHGEFATVVDTSILLTEVGAV
jgi:nicotinamidase-related amidase